MVCVSAERERERERERDREGDGVNDRNDGFEYIREWKVPLFTPIESPTA